jgi:CheY-like chemotaxis protein
MSDIYALIADDYGPIRAQLRILLEGEGFRVVEAEDGREAIDFYDRLLREGKDCRLAVIDHYMPHYKGDVVTVKIREKAEGAGVAAPKIFMLTGSKDGDLVARSQAAGLTELFIKPEGIVALHDRIVGRPVVAR